MSFIIKKPFFLSDEYFPSSSQGNRSLSYYRERLLDKNNTNLNFLIEKRYDWMKTYISTEMRGIELGCGIGASKTVLSEYNYILSDVYKHKWIDEVIDAMKIPYEDESFDYIIISNVIHHLSKPLAFFEEARRVLKPNGIILMNDVNCSLLMRIILKILKHEGFSFNRNPFDINQDCNNPQEPWSGNNAIINIMLQKKSMFERETKFKIIKEEPCEIFTFILSGGVSSEFFTIKLPKPILKIFYKFDQVLSKFNRVFPLSLNLVFSKYS